MKNGESGGCRGEVVDLGPLWLEKGIATSHTEGHDKGRKKRR